MKKDSIEELLDEHAHEAFLALCPSSDIEMMSAYMKGIEDRKANTEDLLRESRKVGHEYAAVCADHPSIPFSDVYPERSFRGYPLLSIENGSRRCSEWVVVARTKGLEPLCGNSHQAQIDPQKVLRGVYRFYDDGSIELIAGRYKDEE